LGNFEQLTKIPRPSKKEGKVLAYLADWAKKNNLEYKQDAAGNIVLRSLQQRVWKSHTSCIARAC